MTMYRKILIAKHDLRLQCLSNDGEYLIAVSPKRKTKVKLRKNDHYFIGLQSGEPSLYGWVSELQNEFKIEDFMEMIKNTPSYACIGNNQNEIEIQVKLTLESIKNYEIGTTVVTDLTEKSFKDKTLVQKVHKVFLRSS